MKTWIWPLKFSKGAAPRRRCFSPLRARTRTIAEKSRKVGSNPLSVAAVYCLPSCHALSCFNYHLYTTPMHGHPLSTYACVPPTHQNRPASTAEERRSVCAAKSSIVETCLAVCGAASFLLENDSSGLSKAKIFSGAPPPTPRSRTHLWTHLPVTLAPLSRPRDMRGDEPAKHTRLL